MRLWRIEVGHNAEYETEPSFVAFVVIGFIIKLEADVCNFRVHSTYQIIRNFWIQYPNTRHSPWSVGFDQDKMKLQLNS